MNNHGSESLTVMNIPGKFTRDLRSDCRSSSRRANPFHPPINNQNLPDGGLLQESLRGDSHVVEKAEAHRFVWFRVVARWTDDRHGPFAFAIGNGHRGLYCGSATEPDRGRSFVVDEQRFSCIRSRFLP